ncbi:MAG: NAD(P)/FAD-dependent oxidoreductase [Saprospiraceae bacterium]|nr:NAD(P)/FAD-dependent oxidoreductase [Saprospiraceae bacterium]MCB9326509.1 NAD(P)/FAD-dependent oxidoreductase [Lewinellaceae bacterium]
MIQSYKQKHEVADYYDTIIIGSGMGSLTTGALLSKEGQKVLILERHYTAGGFTHVFKRKGYEWDVGIHYIGEVQRPDSLTKKLFDYVTDGQLQWADMGEVYDKIIIGDKSYDLVKGVQQFKAKLIEYFPDEKNAINDYVNLIFECTKTSRNFYVDKALPPVLSKLIGGWMRKPFNQFSDRTTYEVLKTITDNEELIRVLTGQYGDYGLPPKKSAFVMHAAVVRHYFNGGSFPIGGSSRIVETIDPVIAAAGGTILINAEVDKVVVKNNKATGVQMNDGRIFSAKNIVSGAGIMTTYKKLLPAEVVKQHKLPEQLQKINRSVSHACLYIGLKGSPRELELPKTNYWVYPGDTDHDTCVDRYVKNINEPFPVIYISFPSAKDPDWSNRYPGRSSIDIITLVPFDVFEKWEGSQWMKRGSEYDELKEKIAARLLDELYRQLPHLKGKVDHYELSSPLTTQHFVNYGKGEIYGIDHSPSRFRQRFLKPRTPIKNFYLTGQDIVTAGVAGALFSGVLTVGAMTGINVIKKIVSK